MKGKPKPFLRNSEIDELCERLIYEYMGDDGAGKPVDIINITESLKPKGIRRRQNDKRRLAIFQKPPLHKNKNERYITMKEKPVHTGRKG